MDQTILREVGHRLYQTERLKEMKRYLVFRARCRMHKKDINGLLDFFAETPERQAILHGTPAFVEQATRAFFYKGSDYADRIALIKITCYLWNNILLRRLFPLCMLMWTLR